jgi:hypothetical protein
MNFVICEKLTEPGNSLRNHEYLPPPPLVSRDASDVRSLSGLTIVIPSKRLVQSFPKSTTQLKDSPKDPGLEPLAEDSCMSLFGVFGDRKPRTEGMKKLNFLNFLILAALRLK